MIRSLFFAPANRPDLVVKFPRFSADCNVIDLEDGTPDAEKASARAALAETVKSAREAGLQGMLAVRVNVPDSPHYLADLEAAFACDIDAVVIPKLETPAQAQAAVHWLEHGSQSAERKPMLIGGIESVRGVLNAVDICDNTPGLGAVYFGAEDFAADIGGRRTREGDEVATARGWVVMAARAAGLIALDQAVLDIRDDALFTQDASRGCDMGYQGKICVAPAQVALANAAFSPTPEEVEYARRLVATYEEATARGIGTIDFEGKMVDGPLLKRSQAVLAAAGEA
ncbi:CoA ester lyase [Achromobacter sp. F4_2707]|uniref:HpcH/HpaI aldolase/citrate lyase family protein n=1 Tax=Achromobacter sp. F4_2707 TaxID=3114286 RepID=UPI0039C73E4E